VNIEIEHGNSLRPSGQSVQGGDGNVAEITKPHHFVPCGVMSGRAHETEDGFADAGLFKCEQGGASRKAGEGFDFGKPRGVRIKIVGNAQPGEVFGRMRAEQGFVGGGRRREPVDGKVGLRAQFFQGVRDARRAFRMSGTVIARAARVGDNLHRLIEAGTEAGRHAEMLNRPRCLHAWRRGNSEMTMKRT
jgi:hypothetical protein